MSNEPAVEKKCQELINMGFNSYTTEYRVFRVKTPTGEMVQAIGFGKHSLNMLEPELRIRLYNCKFEDFPVLIYRCQYDFDGPFDHPIDKFLVFQNDTPFTGNPKL